MFFQESESIARDHPDLQRVVARVDQELSAVLSAPVLRPADFSYALGVEENQVTSVFELLAQRGALQEAEMVECDHCQNLMPAQALSRAIEDEDPLECTGCSRIYPKRAKPILVYRLTTDALHRIKAERNLRGLMVSKNHQTIREEPLGERARLVLEAMLDLGAIDSDRRRTTEEIAVKAMGHEVDANALKSVMSELKSRKLIDSAKGRSGGYWLTESGCRRAENLRNPATV